MLALTGVMMLAACNKDDQSSSSMLKGTVWSRADVSNGEQYYVLFDSFTKCSFVSSEYNEDADKYESSSEMYFYKYASPTITFTYIKEEYTGTIVDDVLTLTDSDGNETVYLKTYTQDRD